MQIFSFLHFQINFSNLSQLSVINLKLPHNLLFSQVPGITKHTSNEPGICKWRRGPHHSEAVFRKNSGHHRLLCLHLHIASLVNEDHNFPCWRGEQRLQVDRSETVVPHKTGHWGRENNFFLWKNQRLAHVGWVKGSHAFIKYSPGQPLSWTHLLSSGELLGTSYLPCSCLDLCLLCLVFSNTDDAQIHSWNTKSLTIL